MDEIKDRYRTLASESLAGLDALVNRFVAAGWTPMGGPVFGTSANREIWVQAVWADRQSKEPWA